MTFELQPTLAGDLLSLRPMRADDFDALYAVAKDRANEECIFDQITTTLP